MSSVWALAISRKIIRSMIPRRADGVLGLKETSVAAVKIGFPDSRARLRIPLIADATRPPNKRFRCCGAGFNRSIIAHCLLSSTHMHICKPSLIAVVTLHGGYVGIGTRIKLAFGPSSRFFFQKRGQVYSPTTGTPATPARLSHGRQRTGCHPPSMSHFGDLQAMRISSCPQLMCPSGDRCQNEPMYHFIGQDLTKPRLNRESTACKSINMS